MVNKSNKVF